MQRHFAQEILRISLFIYYKNIHFAQEISWKMSKNFSLAQSGHAFHVNFHHYYFYYDKFKEVSNFGLRCERSHYMYTWSSGALYCLTFLYLLLCFLSAFYIVTIVVSLQPFKNI